MLFNHYINEMEKTAIAKACKRFDFSPAFEKYSDTGDFDRDRKYDLLAMAVAGVPNTRRALAYGIDFDEYGDANFGIPSQKAAHGHNDRDLRIEHDGLSINVPVLKTEDDAKRWLSKLNDNEKDLAKAFILELYAYAVDAYNEEGRYIEGVRYPEYPEWLDEEKKGA
nr:MAG TPA: hypothetical protein [Caudoviricetes sp.]